MSSGFVFVGGNASTKRLIRVCRASASEELTFEDLEGAAARRGFRISDRSAGPLLAFDAFAEDKRIGFSTGYVVPGLKRLHIEGMKVGQNASKGGSLLDANAAKILVLCLIVRAAEMQAADIYGLAIKDEEEQHRRLSNYIQRMTGAVPVREVGGSLKDAPDRVVWGGEGTIFRASVSELLRKWAPIIHRMARR
ncbi:hypothetical protein NDN08_004713 [Rhodosorus marinus]|uniref:Uncharacterized protein n=1 Tax=Rhodosorus marinus TaxID=101924 RepID=A0AAV8UNJ6_9RHOD|nr:hypothetical protein NDN08_004713 [Rhodosorus marinus]